MNSSDLNQRAKAVFMAALEKESPELRNQYLDQACVDDPELRREVVELLAALKQSDSFLENKPGAAFEQTAIHTTASMRVGETIGPYKLLEEIGEGGMGSVWIAQQSEPIKRKVAIKLIKAGMDSKAVLARFGAERQALAMMDHPNIARVLDGGMTDQGRPYFAMEYVKGVPLTEYCDHAKLSVKERLQLFLPICNAVQHAHQKGIIHRDLKPSNILVCLFDGKPVPKVIDFGLAKAIHQSLTDQSLHTAHGVMVGTPLYMSPEQAEHNNLDIDTRTDVYSLGVILYELLTGTTPLEKAQFKQAAAAEMLRLIREVEPPKPSTRLSGNASLPSVAAQRSIDPKHLTRSIAGDLDWVVMKALEKERTRRYETANGLAADILRHLSDEPVSASPPSRRYRMQKFIKRNRAGVMAAGAIGVALLLGIAGTTTGMFWAIKAQTAESEAKKEAVVAAQAERQANAELQSSNTLLDQQRTRAEQREQQAIDAVKRFRDAVADNPELKNNPALESLRNTLLKEPLSFFQELRNRLESDGDTRPESLARLADASFELGTLINQIGNKQDALIAYRASEEIYQKLVDANPNLSQYRGQLANCHHNLGKVMSEVGEQPRAEVGYRKAISIYRKLVDDNPAEADFKSSLAAIHNDIGLLMIQTGRSADAMSAYESALAIQQKLVDADPTSTQYQSMLATLHSHIGSVLRTIGKSVEATKSHEAALAIRQELADANPTEPNFQSELAAAHHNIGSLLADTGKPVEAMKEYQAALAIQQKVADANPTVTQFQTFLANHLNSIGSLQSATGSVIDAQESRDRALKILQKLADANPSVTDFQSLLASSHHTRGEFLRDSGRLDEAMQAFNSAIQIQKTLVDANPAITSYHSLLADHYDGIGLLLTGSEKSAEAIQAFETALAIRQKLADSNPALVQLQTNLATTLIRMGNLLAANEQYADAMKAFNSALAIQQKQADADPTIPLLQSTLANTHSNIGETLRKTGNPAEALKILRMALAIQKKVVDANPTVTQYQIFLANHYGIIGQLLNSTGEPVQAMEAMKSELAIRQKLVDTVPTNLRYKADLATPYSDIGDLLNATGNPVEALKAHESALAILNELASSNLAESGYRSRLANCHNHIGDVHDANGRPAEAQKAWQLELLIRQKLVRQFPESPEFASGMGAVLHNLAILDLKAEQLEKGRAGLGEAIEWQAKALTARPGNAEYRQFMLGHLYSLAMQLANNGQLDAATVNYGKGLVLDPKNTAFLFQLSYLLAEQKRDSEGSIAIVRRWLDIDPMNGGIHLALGRSLRRDGQLEAAIASFQKAIELKPSLCYAHVGVGETMLDKGRYAEARAALERAVELLPDNDTNEELLTQMIENCARLEKLEERFPALVEGQEQPASAQEFLDIAVMCRHKQMHAAAVRFAVEAYAADPGLGNNLDSGYRYDMARSAARAASGEGEGAADLDDNERSRLRMQALNWLRADFALHTNQLKTGSPDDRTEALASLSHWQLVSDFTDLRDNNSLAKLPTEERAEYTRHWTEVAEVLTKLEQDGISAFGENGHEEANQPMAGNQ